MEVKPEMLIHTLHVWLHWGFWQKQSHEFEKKMLQRMEEIDGIVLACRERMMEQAGNDSLKL